MRSERWVCGGRSWRVSVPETRHERSLGLRRRYRLDPDEALLIFRCRSVHTFGMGFTIEVALLDAALRVLSVTSMRPGRLQLPRFGVRHVLELPVGSGVQRGDQLTNARISWLAR